MNDNVQNCDVIKGPTSFSERGSDGEESSLKHRAQCLCEDSAPVQATDI